MRLFKLSENGTPTPGNRVFFNYQHFRTALVAADQSSVNSDYFTFGFEKTLTAHEHYSFELRIPFASSLDDIQQAFRANTATELGDVVLAFKGLLYEDQRWAAGAGWVLSLPTSDNAVLLDPSGNEILAIRNKSIHMGPFLGLVRRPSGHDRLSLVAMTQFDFDLNGNPYVFPVSHDRGRIQEPSLWMVDLSLGYWIYRAPECGHLLQGVASLLEVHYTTTMQDADNQVSGNDSLITFGTDRYDILNLTAGLQLLLGHCTDVRIAAVAPMREGTDRVFDAALGAQLNRRF